MNTFKNFDLTALEIKMLNDIIDCYDVDDVICYQAKLTPSQKGVIGSLIKKGLVYDSFVGDGGIGDNGNFYPSEEILIAAGI